MKPEILDFNPPELLEKSKDFLRELYSDSVKAQLILNNINSSDIYWINNTDDEIGFFNSDNMLKSLKSKMNEDYPNYTTEYDKPIHIPLNRGYWLTYEIEELGWYVNDVECDPILSILIVLVHELTHAIQFVEGRDLSETETTQNEFKFVEKENEEFFKNSLIAI